MLISGCMKVYKITQFIEEPKLIYRQSYQNSFDNFQILTQLSMRPVAPKGQVLHLNISTWEKDSHGLYDYEADRLIKDYFRIEGPCKIFRNWQSTHTSIISNDKIKKGHLPDENQSFLSSIIMNRNGNYDQFVLLVPETPSQQIFRKESTQDQNIINTNSYIVVKDHRDNHPEKGFPLKPGNIIKVGRVEFKIVEIGGLPKHKNKQILENIFLGEFNGVFQATQRMEGACKICLGQDNQEDNFLISPCKCKGYCGFIHVQCLKQWIDSKVKKEVVGVVKTYNFNKFECEICKFPFPRMVVRDKFQLEMITIERPDRPYLILEGINERKQSKEERCMHVISPTEGTSVKIGRGHQCEIRLQDISVSRQHSDIKYSAGEFYINDQDSKFGTLVRVDKNIDLSGRLRLQIGRSIYEFTTQ